MSSWLERLAAAEPSDRKVRRIVGWIIAAWITLHLVIPLGYYLRDDPSDERFAWRMFSAVRVQDCEVTVRERTATGDREVSLARTIHSAWQESLERNRRAVVEKFLALRCRDESVHEVVLIRQCRSATHERLPPTEYIGDCGRAGTP